MGERIDIGKWYNSAVSQFQEFFVNSVTNLVIQIILMGWVAFASYVAKFKRGLQIHCWFMRAAVVLLIATILLVMLPSFIAYSRVGFRLTLFYSVMYVHVAMGLLVVGTWIYINLALAGIIKMKRRLVVPMRLVAGLWVVSLVTGLFMYIYVRI